MGLYFTPDAVVTTDAVSDFTAKQPVAGELEPCATAGQNPCTSGTLNTVTSFSQPTKDAFNFAYNLGNGSDTGFRRFGGALINFDPTKTYNAQTNAIVLGLKSSNSSLNIDVTDINGKTVTI